MESVGEKGGYICIYICTCKHTYLTNEDIQVNATRHANTTQTQPLQKQGLIPTNTKILTICCSSAKADEEALQVHTSTHFLTHTHSFVSDNTSHVRSECAWVLLESIGSGWRAVGPQYRESHYCVLPVFYPFKSYFPFIVWRSPEEWSERLQRNWLFLNCLSCFCLASSISYDDFFCPMENLV